MRRPRQVVRLTLADSPVRWLQEITVKVLLDGPRRGAAEDSTSRGYRINGAFQFDGVEDHECVVRSEPALPIDLGPSQDDLATVGTAWLRRLRLHCVPRALHRTDLFRPTGRHAYALRRPPDVASVAAIPAGDQIGSGLSMLIKSPSHLIPRVSGVLAYRDTASAARGIRGPQQRRAHVLLTGIRQDQRCVDGDITPVVPEMHHQWIRFLTLIHFRAGEPQPLQEDTESASSLSHEGLHSYVHSLSMSLVPRGFPLDRACRGRDQPVL